MSNAWHVASRTIKVELKTVKFWISTLLMPFFMGLVGLVIFSNYSSSSFFRSQKFLQVLERMIPKSIKPLPVGIVDEAGIVVFEGSAGSQDLEPLNRAYRAYSGREEAEKALAEHQIKGYLIVNSDFLKRPDIKIFWYEKDENQPELKRLATMLRARLVETLGEEQLKPFLLEPLSGAEVRYLQQKAEKNAEENSMNPEKMLRTFVPAFGFSGMLFFMLVMSLDRLVRGMLEERKNRLMEVLLSAMSARDLMMGKLIGTGALSLLQLGIWFVLLGAPLLLLVSGFVIGFDKIILMLLFVLVTYALFATLVLGLGVFGGTQQEAMQWIMPFFLPMVMVVYLLPFLEQLNHYVWFQFAVLVPMLGSLLALVLYTADLVQLPIVLLGLVAQLFYVYLAFRISVRLFRFGLLAKGQSFSLKYLLRSWRQSAA